MESSHFLDEDVPDPTDFPLNAPGLRQLDDALRCSVCRELYSAPVTVNCPSGHCFCSACIRTTTSESHTVKPVCPLCRESISEMQFRRNQSMEDAVKAWKKARPYVLGLVAPRITPVPSSQSSTTMTGSAANTPRKKRKLNPINEIDDEDEIVEVSAPKQEILGSSSRQATPLPSTSEQPPSIVDCPMCNKQVPSAIINIHMDTGCPPPTQSEMEKARQKQASSSKNKQKEQWHRLLSSKSGTSSSSTTKWKGKARATTPLDDFSEPLPKASYDTLKTKRIKELLHESNLSTVGEKSTLIARHQRWVIMYNANRDASESERKSLSQLHEALRVWEESEERRKKVNKNDVDVVAHQERHKTMFEKLTEAARKSGRPSQAVSPAAATSVAEEPGSSQPRSSHTSLTTDETVIVADDGDS